jgi:hypothetical protein
MEKSAKTDRLAQEVEPEVAFKLWLTKSKEMVKLMYKGVMGHLEAVEVDLAVVLLWLFWKTT